jgi:hypothetical protein
MTYKISIEALGNLTAEGFAKLVEQRIATLREYDVHEAIVRQHATVEDMPDEERYVHLAVPAAPFAEVDSAIRRSRREDGTSEFTADYEIVGPSFEVRKARLFEQVSRAEAEALAAVLPAGKVRAFQFREMDIRRADQLRHVAVLANDPAADFDFVKARPPADTRFLDEQAAREDQRNEIARHAAQLHSDIEDLTPDTIDAFEVKPFHG